MATRGAGAATIRAIAREVGVTDAAIYRHYRSKDELYWSAYTQITQEMVQEKEPLLNRDEPIHQRLREWIRLTYRFYDQHPDAFYFVFIQPHDPPEEMREITLVQGEILGRMITQAQRDGEIRDLRTELALSHFTGLLLNVPRLISAGALQGPAERHIDDVFDAVWRIFRPDPPRTVDVAI